MEDVYSDYGAGKVKHLWISPLFSIPIYLLSASCAIMTPPQVNLVARFRDNSSVDLVARDFARRLHLQTSYSNPDTEPASQPGHAIEIYGGSLMVSVVPTALDECDLNPVFDGRSYAISVATLGSRGSREIEIAERELRSVVANFGGTVRQRKRCPFEPAKG